MGTLVIYILVSGFLGIKLSSSEIICNGCTRYMRTTGLSSRVIVQSSYSQVYSRGRNYTMQFRSDLGAFINGYHVSFRTIDTYKEDSVQIYSTGIRRAKVSGPRVLIDTESTIYSYDIKGSSFDLLWITNQNASHPARTVRARGFELTVTAYEYSPCSNRQFRCDFSMCIDRRWTCDGRNDCGNLQDERNLCLRTRIGMIIGVIIACLAVTALISTIVLCLRRRRSSAATVIRTNLIPRPVPANPAYIPLPIQQPYAGASQNFSYPHQPHQALGQRPQAPSAGMENMTYNHPSYPHDPPPPYPTQHQK